MGPANKDLIVFLGIGKLYFSDGDRILSFDLLPGVVRDWDIINKETLQDTLNTFIVVNKIEPSQITFILSEPSCFSKEIQIKDPQHIDAEVQEFLDAVPFNYIVSKVYRMGEGARVIVGNKDFIDTVCEVLESRGFPLFAVVPAAIFPGVGTKTELDMQFVKAVAGSREIVQTGNMVLPKPVAPEIAAATAQPAITTSKANSGSLPYLIGVGAIAVIVLVALILLRK